MSSYLKDDPAMGSMITSELSFDRLVDFLYAAWEGSSNVKPLSKILKRCDNAKTRRNQLVHSEWYLDSEDGEGAMRVKMGYRSGKGFQVKHEKITPEMMEEVAGELYSCRRELAKFIYDHLPE